MQMNPEHLKTGGDKMMKKLLAVGAGILLIGLLGCSQEEKEAVTEKAKETMNKAVESTKEIAGDIADKTEDVAKDVSDATKKAAEGTEEAVKDMTHAAAGSLFLTHCLNFRYKLHVLFLSIMVQQALGDRGREEEQLFTEPAGHYQYVHSSFHPKPAFNTIKGFVDRLRFTTE